MSAAVASASSAARVLADVERDGFTILRECLTGAELDAMRAEAEWLLASERPWLSRTLTDYNAYATIAPAGVPAGERDRLRNIHGLFSQQLFKDAALQYLHSNAYVDRIIVNRERPRPQPVTEWHADQQAQGLLSFKYMLYLNDVTSTNGAFSYVPGSHRIIRNLMARAQQRGISNTKLHEFAQIRDLARELQMPEAIAMIDQVSSHIRGDFESDDHYSLSAPAGSIIVFDPKGLHRGGVVREGERLLIRIHCFQPQPITWKGAVKKLLTGRFGHDFFPLGRNAGSLTPVKEYG